MAATHLLLTRPLAEAERTAVWLRADGFRVTLAPCLEIETYIPTIGYVPDAVLLTSQQAVVALMALNLPRTIPIFTVGPATAATLREGGFTHVDEIAEDALALLARVRHTLLAPAQLLYLRGQEVRHDLAGLLNAENYQVESALAYVARAAAALPQDAVDALREGRLDAVLFYSVRTVQSFTILADTAGLGDITRRLPAICISKEVSQAAIAEGFSHTSIVPLHRGEAALPLLKTLFS